MKRLLKRILINSILFLAFICQGQSFDKIDLLKTELVSAENDSVRIQLYANLAKEYWDIYPDSSYSYIRKQINLATQTNNNYEIAKGNEVLGVWLISNGEHAKAIQFLNISLNIFDELRDVNNVAYVYSSLGYAHLAAYETDKAISYYLKSLNLFKELKNENGVSELFIEIGNLFYLQKNYEEARCYFEDALVIKEEIQDLIGIAIVYTNLGNVISEQNNFELGLDYYNKSILINEKLNDEYGLATNYNNVGDVFIHMEQFDKAQSYFQKSQEIVKNIHYPELEATINLSIGECFLLDGKYYSAIKYLEKSLAISQNLHNLEFMKENYKFLSQAYSKLNEFEKANELFFKYDEIKLNLEQIENERKKTLFNTITELEESYFTIDNLSAENQIVISKNLTEKKIRYVLIAAIIVFSLFILVLINQQSSKKKAYKLLIYKNYLIEKINQENTSHKKDLEELNRTKDRLFSIIGHDLKNPFNSILGFSDLLIENFDSYDKDKKLKFLKIIKDSSIRTDALLNNLLLWANNQSGNIQFKPRSLQLSNIVLNVIELVKTQAVNKDIELKTNISPNIFVEADENMLNTIFRNLITNAIKFTNTGGRVDISTRVEEESVTVFVKDTGVGISEELINRLFSIHNKSTSRGTNNEQGSGLGLILCHDFIKQNGGELFIESKINEGSTFYFTIPLYKEKAALDIKTA